MGPLPPDAIKRCSKCGTEKLRSEFYLKGTKGKPHGRSSKCKECAKKSAAGNSKKDSVRKQRAIRKSGKPPKDYRPLAEIRAEAAEKRAAKIAAKPSTPTAWERLCKTKSSELARKEDKWKKRANSARVSLRRRGAPRTRKTTEQPKRLKTKTWKERAAVAAQFYRPIVTKWERKAASVYSNLRKRRAARLHHQSLSSFRQSRATAVQHAASISSQMNPN
jgi:hypothetical protein